MGGASPGAVSEARCDEAVKKLFSICFGFGGLEMVFIELFVDHLSIGIGGMGANDGFSLVSVQGVLKNCHHEVLFGRKWGNVIRARGMIVSEDIVKVLGLGLNG